MTEYPAIRDPNRCPTHPGAVLADILIDIKKSKAEIARLLGISRQQLYDILDERRPVTPAMAVRISKMFGGSTESWVRMQGAYDTWHAEREVDVSHIPRLHAA
ncbi:hypothetical protein GCM10011491_26690 [Brucella endophytica]|uniref:HTH cro/C1-type domain-containing protein n=1 Tax=Brucella endophytica TaxID=1963359 RepID=A0A916WHA4_9HYPH|nr:HigA family addiction module antitoxin [Brucella endophytica]GGA97035.1 hypothetical protein GCM10011491_26690 [Brucella endophytica]